MRKSAFRFAAVVLCGLGMAPLLVETDAIDAHDALARHRARNSACRRALSVTQLAKTDQDAASCDGAGSAWHLSFQR
jgi:hypothetical protein